MGFQIETGVSAAAVYLQGLLSFFSPCVLPLLPLYMGYLSGGTAKRDEMGNPVYDRKKVMLHTLFFVLGVSFAFFVLGFGVSVLGRFFKQNQELFARAGGILVLLFGLYQLGLFGNSRLLGREHRLSLGLERLAMSPGTAFLMGFTFSFAWTPCVGPVLASVLLMTASAATATAGFFLLLLYTLGFVMPFLFLGLFTTSLLSWFQRHRGILRYTGKLGGVLMLLIGALMVSGRMNEMTGYLSGISGQERIQEDAAEQEDTAEQERIQEDTAEQETQQADAAEQDSESAQRKLSPAIPFALTDQYGKIHTLEEYEGKIIFLNFWATWCPPCRSEMPDIQALYEEYGENAGEELVVLGVAAPNLGRETSVEGISAFLEENGYTYPVLMDQEAALFRQYGITSYPTTFMIDGQGNVYGYVSGALSQDMMRSIIEQTMEGTR